MDKAALCLFKPREIRKQEVYRIPSDNGRDYDRYLLVPSLVVLTKEEYNILVRATELVSELHDKGVELE